MLREFYKRNLNRLFEHRLNLLGYKNFIGIGSIEHYSNYRNTEIINNFLKSKNMHKPSGDLQKELEEFLLFALNKFLDTYCLMADEERHYKAKYNYRFMNEVLDYVSREKFEFHTVAIKYNCLMLKLTEERKYYDKLKEYKNGYMNILSEYELDFIYNSMSGYLARINNKYNKRDEEEYKIAKEQLGMGLLYNSQKYMTDSFFLNFVLSCISLKKYGEAEDSILKINYRLCPITRNDAINLSYARLYVAQNEYQKALSTLANVKGMTWFYRMESDFERLRCYYELNYCDEATICLLDSYKHFVLNNRHIYEEYRQRNYNFAKYLSELFRIRNGCTNSDIKDLKNKIVSQNACKSKNWLLEKLSEPENIYPPSTENQNVRKRDYALNTP